MPVDALVNGLFVGRYAIKGSPNQKLLLEDIYYAIESRVRWVITRIFRESTDSTS